MNFERKAVTLVEAIAVIGIITLLLAMLLPAIIRVQSISLKMQSMNNLRTIMQGFIQYSADHAGKLPGISLESIAVDVRKYPFYAILPYLDIGFREPWGQMGENSMEYPQVKYYLSPTDPSTSDPTMPMVRFYENTSYSTNAMVFDGLNGMSGISDGLSYTIGMSERYRGCFNNGVNSCIFVSRGAYPILTPGTKFRTSTFADKGYGDVLPVTLNGISRPSVLGVTFQNMPAVENADGRLLQATQREGLLTIMMDCSVRSFNAGVKSEVFWAAITPVGNEVIAWD